MSDRSMTNLGTRMQQDSMVNNLILWTDSVWAKIDMERHLPSSPITWEPAERLGQQLEICLTKLINPHTGRQPLRQAQ